VRAENCGCAEIYQNKGNEEIYAEKENFQHNGDYLARSGDWLTPSIFFAGLARRTHRKGKILTEYWYMIAINSKS
jgi:hypothetical protein